MTRDEKWNDRELIQIEMDKFLDCRDDGNDEWAFYYWNEHLSWFLLAHYSQNSTHSGHGSTPYTSSGNPQFFKPTHTYHFPLILFCRHNNHKNGRLSLLSSFLAVFFDDATFIDRYKKYTLVNKKALYIGILQNHILWNTHYPSNKKVTLFLSPFFNFSHPFIFSIYFAGGEKEEKRNVFDTFFRYTTLFSLVAWLGLVWWRRRRIEQVSKWLYGW